MHLGVHTNVHQVICPAQSTLKDAQQMHQPCPMDCCPGLNAERQKRDYLNELFEGCHRGCAGVECEIWAGWFLYRAQQPNSSAHWIPSAVSAGGPASPWKHWLGQGYIGANYRSVSLGGPIYWKIDRRGAVSCPVRTCAYGTSCVAGCTTNNLNWGLGSMNELRGYCRKILAAQHVFLQYRSLFLSPLQSLALQDAFLPSSWIICYAYDCRLHFN